MVTINKNIFGMQNKASQLDSLVESIYVHLVDISDIFCAIFL